MGTVIITKEFNIRLNALRKTGKRTQYQQASTIVLELLGDMSTSKKLRAESRIPNCYKYELPDGYRVVFQKIDDSDDFMALFVGSHDDVDHYLDKHMGWVFDPRRQNVKELRLGTDEKQYVNIVASSSLQVATTNEGGRAPTKVFADLNANHIEKAGVPLNKVDTALSLSDPDSVETMMFLQELPQQTSNILLAYITGDEETRMEIKSLFAGERELLTTINKKVITAVESSDEFVDLRSIPEEKLAFDTYSLEEWMLFLHPDQHSIVSKEYKGAVRVRGVSGSGKTVVAIHRARHIARTIVNEPRKKVLFVTFNRSLADLVSNLINKLCLPREADKIIITTIDKWCRNYVTSKRKTQVEWDDSAVDAIFVDSLKKHMADLKNAGLCKDINPSLPIASLKRELDIQFLQDEIDFIYGRFVSDFDKKYLDCDRTGRIRRLTQPQRQEIYNFYLTYSKALRAENQFVSREINRMALEALREDRRPSYEYEAIIADEVQDLSENELRVLRRIAEDPQKLFLVGDGAQRIYTKGYSFKNASIDIVGRSIVLKHNYRNTKEISTVAKALMESQGIGKYDDEPQLSQMTPTASSHIGEKPKLIVAKSQDEEWKIISAEIKYLIENFKILPHEICCLARVAWERDGIKATLSNIGLQAVEYRADGIGADNAIKVSTLHNAKGHEFKVVFILGFFDGAIPLLDKTYDPENLEGEAALLYVAITRAKNLLYFSYPKKDRNGKELVQSRFIESFRDKIDIVEF